MEKLELFIISYNLNIVCNAVLFIVAPIPSTHMGLSLLVPSRILIPLLIPIYCLQSENENTNTLMSIKKHK